MFESFFVREGRTAAWWRSGLEAARALLPLLPQYKDDPAAVQRLQDRIRGLGATLLHFFQIDTRRRNVFCHGDAWISNFLFTYQQEKPDKVRARPKTTAHLCSAVIAIQIRPCSWKSSNVF